MVLLEVDKSTIFLLYYNHNQIDVKKSIKWYSLNELKHFTYKRSVLSLSTIANRDKSLKLALIELVLLIWSISFRLIQPLFYYKWLKLQHFTPHLAKSHLQSIKFHSTLRHGVSANWPVIHKSDFYALSPQLRNILVISLSFRNECK